MRWFGRSKVVDEANNPKIVYHGTTKGFDVFQTRKRNPELGFHFGSVSQAEWFATYDEERGTLSGGNIRPVYLRIEHPLRMPDIFVRSVHSTETALYWLYREGLVCKPDCANVCRARSARDAHTRLAELIEALGYDGIVYKNDQEGGPADSNEDSYAVFWLDQIRSAFEFDNRYLTSDWKKSLVCGSSQ